MYGGWNRNVVVLDTTDGLVIWMACPDEVLKASFPQPSTLIYPLPGVLDGNPDIRDEARITIDNSEDDASEDGRGNGSAIGEETPPTSDDDRDNEDTISGDSDDGDSTVESEDADEMSWGPSWSVRHFFRDAEEPLPLSQFHPKRCPPCYRHLDRYKPRWRSAS
jgi:hypothetical protein